MQTSIQESGDKVVITIDKDKSKGQAFHLIGVVINRIDLQDAKTQAYTVSNLIQLRPLLQDTQEDIRDLSASLASNMIGPLCKTLAKQGGISLEQLVDDISTTLGDTRLVQSTDINREPLPGEARNEA